MNYSIAHCPQPRPRPIRAASSAASALRTNYPPHARAAIMSADAHMADDQLESEVGSASRRDELAHKCALCLQAIKELEDDISDQRTNLIEYKLEIRGMDRRSRGESLDTDDKLEP